MEKEATAGYFDSGLPFNRLGNGARILVVFQGLQFENKPMTGYSASSIVGMYKFLQEDYATYLVLRKPGLPGGYSMKDMSDDYATMINAALHRVGAENMGLRRILLAYAKAGSTLW